MLIGIKEQDTTEDRYREIGRYTVQNSTVTIPVSHGDLVSYFGITHYSVWLRILGGRNGQGIRGVWIDMKGTLPDGGLVSINKGICLGSNPLPTPTPIPTLTPILGSLHNLTVLGSPVDEGATYHINGQLDSPSGSVVSSPDCIPQVVAAGVNQVFSLSCIMPSNATMSPPTGDFSVDLISRTVTAAGVTSAVVNFQVVDSNV